MIAANSLERLAFIDELTGTMNKNALLSDFDGVPINDNHFIYVDIDDFKTMNTVFGIDAVDFILKHVAMALKDYCEQGDVYRIGGGQFILTTKSHFICEPVALQKLLIQPVKIEELQIVVNASICVFDHEGFEEIEIHELLKLMQLTLAVEKKKGRNQLVYFTEQKRKEYNLKKEIALNLYSAVKNHEFYPKFQPFMDTFTHEIIGMKTVSRWDLNGVRLRPHLFLDAAEWTGLIYDIELDMFVDAVKFYRELLNMKDIKLSPRFKVAVHFSRYTLKRVDILTLLGVLDHYGISKRNVIIQTRERYITDSESYAKIKNFREVGFMIILDNYTNKNSSLSLLSDLKVDAISLSKDLLEDMDNDEEYMKKMNVYKYKVEISKKFDFTVIADGINSEQNEKLIKELDVHIGLGRYYSRAILKENFIEFIKNNKKKR